MKILLVSPPSGDLTIGLKHLAKVEPLGLEIIDAIILGEGVPAFQAIVERWRQGRDFDDVAGLAIPGDGRLRFTPPRPLPATLDHQPLPDRSLTARYRSRYFYLFESPVASIQTSLGCTFPCNFCSCQKFTHRRFIPRSPELVAEDLSRIELRQPIPRWPMACFICSVRREATRRDPWLTTVS